MRYAPRRAYWHAEVKRVAELCRMKCSPGSPCGLYHEADDVIVAVHGDDFVLTGGRHEATAVEQEMGKHLWCESTSSAASPRTTRRRSTSCLPGPEGGVVGGKPIPRRGGDSSARSVGSEAGDVSSRARDSEPRR